MKRILFIATLLIFSFVSIALAQSSRVQVTGIVQDKENKESIIQASVRICVPKDTSMVSGTVTDIDGKFSISSIKAGNYLLVVSYVGYLTEYKTIELKAQKSTFSAGTILLAPDVVALSEALVTAEAPKVVSKGDSLVFNSSAYRVPEGSMLESLVKKLPGADVDKDGNITINGKTISKIMIDGHEFFSEDMSMAMKNIPVEMVEKLKTYDRKSDLSRITGIDDGNEETVLDLSVKKDMSRGFFNNIDVAGGTNERYQANININRFKGDDKYTLITSFDNLEGPWSNSNGTTKSQDYGFNFFKKTEKLELGGDANYNRWGSDAVVEGSSETFLTTNNIFSNNNNRNQNDNKRYNASIRLEWKPDTMTNIIFRPNINGSNNNGYSLNRSATFNKNPYGYTPYPLDEIDNPAIFSDSSRINHTNSESKNDNNSFSGSMEFQFYRRLNTNGRSVTVRSSGNYSKNESHQYNRSTTNYFLLNNKAGGDSLYYQNQYHSTPSKNYNINGQLTYIEPIFKKVYLQFSYKYTYRYDDSNRSTYDLTPYIALNDSNLIGYLPDYYGTPISSLSKLAEYDNNIHEGEVSMRFNREKWNLSFGARLTQTKTTMTYDQGVLDTTVTRKVVNFSPNLFFRYKFNDNTQLRVNYWGNTGQPSMTDMLPVRDETNPMWITEGNPNLESSFSNRLRMDFNTYNSDKQRGFFTHFDFNNTINSVSTKITYNETTGGVVSRPENINGNWSTSGFFGFNTAFKDQRFSINTFSHARFSNQVGYVSVQQSTAAKNTTKSWNLSEHLSGSFRNDWIDFSLEGSINYSTSRNQLQPDNDMDTYQYSFGAELEVELPLDFSISSDFSESSRRGYDDASFNTDEWIWNAQIGYRFLKEKAASITLQVYDILQQRSNVSRNISAISRSDTHYVDVLQSYWMLHFIYRLNIFGV